MKTALPWLLAVVLGAGAVFFFHANQKKSQEISNLESQVGEVESLRAENEDLKKVAAQMGELDRLRRDAGEVLQLRGEVTKLRDQVSTLQTQLQNAQAASAQSLAKLQQQSQQIQEQASQMKQAQDQASVIKQAQDRQTLAVCLANLQQIEAAKRQWALQQGKPAGTVPQAQDLAPYFQNNTLPQCPSGGTYTLNAIGVLPTCSIAGHVYPQQ